MVSTFWQPAVVARTPRLEDQWSPKVERNSEPNLSNSSSVVLLSPNDHVRSNYPTSIPGIMRGQVRDQRGTVGKATIGRMHGQVVRKRTTKKGGKKLIGLGGSSKSFLIFDRKPSQKISSHQMNDKERVKALMNIYRRALRNRRNPNHWEVVKFVKEMYREYLPPMHHQSQSGSIPGIFVGDIFPSRAALSLVGLHGKSQAGIDYMEYVDPKNGIRMLVAVSIVVSGVYEDDCDQGETLIYTGEGGNDLMGTRKQIRDQKLEGGNEALANSCKLEFPVRVIRAHSVDEGKPSSAEYSYDGLYKVVSWVREDGLSKFKVFKYTMIREPNQTQLNWFGGR